MPLTETFVESAEPLCWLDPERDEDEEVVFLEEFLDRWTQGAYLFTGKGKRKEKSFGETDLTFDLPAAPTEVEFQDGVISWDTGDDLGKCADYGELAALVDAEILPIHPIEVPVASWEIVLEPDVEDGDLTGSHKFTIRVKGDIMPREISVPEEYLDSLPIDTPVKIEVGAIGYGDNVTFTEEDGFCVNEDEGCTEDE